MSQQDLANKARLSRVFITRLEAGQQDPSLGTLNTLAQALDRPVTKLLE